MIALRLLMPTLTSDAIEAALGAVIERANSTGALCHEETIGKGSLVCVWMYSLISIVGDYASFVRPPLSGCRYMIQVFALDQSAEQPELSWEPAFLRLQGLFHYRFPLRVCLTTPFHR
jgi:hypothetical protein